MHGTKLACLWLVGVAIVGSAGCDEAKGGGKAEAAAEAKQLFEEICSSCHGSSGKGDGPAAANLPVKPRNYTDKAWQAKAKDEDIAKAIVEGGPAVGLNATMPPNPDLKDKPEIVKALVAHIRSFGK